MVCGSQKGDNFRLMGRVFIGPFDITTVACVQTPPPPPLLRGGGFCTLAAPPGVNFGWRRFFLRATKEIGDVCTQASRRKNQNNGLVSGALFFSPTLVSRFAQNAAFASFGS